MARLRSVAAMILACLVMLVSDLVQRLVIGPWLWLRPGSRHKVLGPWLQFLATAVVRPVELVGGASLQRPDRVVPCAPGVLIVMNHQSMLDLPLAVLALEEGHVSVVTRRRYTRFIPLVSHMSRLYRFPAVDDAAGPRDRRRMLKRLREVAREGDVPLLIYPEGTRSKDGEIGPFRPAGMRLILGARAWEVHVFVVDGMWEHAKFEHLLEGLGSLDARMEYVGVFQWADRKGDPEPFVEDLRQRMIDKLAQMRAGAEPSGFVVSESLGNS